MPVLLFTSRAIKKGEVRIVRCFDSFLINTSLCILPGCVTFYKSHWELLLIISCRAAFMTKMMLVGEQSFKFNIWDTAGQERVMYTQLLICKT